MFHDRGALVSRMADPLGFEIVELCANLYYFGNDTLPILRDLLANDDVMLRLIAALTRNSVTQLLQNNLRFASFAVVGDVRSWEVVQKSILKV